MTIVLYDAIVSIVEYYLGPASERFVSRQIQSHLNKEPHDVDRSDLPQLIEWIQVSMGLLTEDRAAVDECSHKLTQLV